MAKRRLQIQGPQPMDAVIDKLDQFRVAVPETKIPSSSDNPDPTVPCPSSRASLSSLSPCFLPLLTFWCLCSVPNHHRSTSNPLQTLFWQCLFRATVNSILSRLNLGPVSYSHSLSLCFLGKRKYSTVQYTKIHITITVIEGRKLRNSNETYRI